MIRKRILGFFLSYVSRAQGTAISYLGLQICQNVATVVIVHLGVSRLILIAETRATVHVQVISREICMVMREIKVIGRLCGGDRRVTLRANKA